MPAATRWPVEAPGPAPRRARPGRARRLRAGRVCPRLPRALPSAGPLLRRRRPAAVHRRLAPGAGARPPPSGRRTSPASCGRSAARAARPRAATWLSPPPCRSAPGCRRPPPRSATRPARRRHPRVAPAGRRPVRGQAACVRRRRGEARRDVATGGFPSSTRSPRPRSPTTSSTAACAPSSQSSPGRRRWPICRGRAGPTGPGLGRSVPG